MSDAGEALAAMLRDLAESWRVDQAAEDMLKASADLITRLRSELSSAQARCAAMAEGLNEISDVVEATLMRGDATYGLGQIARCVKKALSNTPARASQLLELERAAIEKCAKCFDQDPYLEYQGYEVASMLRALLPEQTETK